jgi:hypothetical protein
MAAMPNMAAMASSCAKVGQLTALGPQGEAACAQGLNALRMASSMMPGGAPAACGGGTAPMAMPGAMPGMPGAMPGAMPGMPGAMPGAMPGMPGAAPGGAQGPLAIGGNVSNFGQRSVTPGFVPDPIDIPVVAGGNIEARALNLGDGCVGYVTRQPDFIVRLTGNSPSLRMYVTSDGDTTLLVNAANGSWHCNDDSYTGTNPTVDLPGATPGQYDVWIGSYQAGQTARGILHITELASNHP